MPELATQWRQVLNVKTKEQLGLPEPTLVTHKVIPVVVPASPLLKRYIQALAARVEAIRRGTVDPSLDNMLSVTGDGRKAALDIRLVLPGVPRPRQSKIMALVQRLKLIYDTFDACKGTQLVFCDLATPKGTRGGGAASEALVDAGETPAPERETAQELCLSNFVYHEIRDELVRRGVPRAEIAFIHEYPTKAARDGLFAAMNDGRVRVLIGSTGMMGSGMNVQQRLIALHNLDCPWRPGDLEQRHGRILRQGNQWPAVYIFTYVTEGSFDGYLYQLIESKARFISQALAGEITARTVEDTAELVLSAAEVKAIASGNPQIVRKVQLETELARMERVRALQLDTQVALRLDRRRTEQAIGDLEARQLLLAQAQAIVGRSSSERFTAAIATTLGSDRTQRFDTRDAAGSALSRIAEQLQMAASMERRPITQRVGSYRGLILQVQAHPLFASEIVVCLPDGAYLDTLHARSEAGLFASADSLIRSLPERRREVAEHIHSRQQRIVEIDAELERLAVWAGQAAYDAATQELASITAAFAAQEAEAAPIASTEDMTDASVNLSAETITAVQARTIETEEPEPPLSIPPAVASLAWMEARLQHQRAGDGTEVVDDVESHADETMRPPLTIRRAPAPAPIVVPPSHHRPTAQPRLLFGQPLPQRRSGTPAEHMPGQQRDLFSALGTPPQTPTPPTTQRIHDHDLVELHDLEQRSLFD